MDAELPTDFTRLLNAARHDPKAAAVMLAGVYDTLRDLARRRMAGERVDHTLCATALVHEAYPDLFPANGTWNDRGHFFRTAAAAMRNVLIDHARGRKRIKRGGGRSPVDLETLCVADLAARSDLDPEIILRVDEAVSELSKTNPEAGQVVLLKFFGGQTHEEVAEALNMSVETVKRRWRFARTRLYRVLEDLRDEPLP